LDSQSLGVIRIRYDSQFGGAGQQRFSLHEHRFLAEELAVPRPKYFFYYPLAFGISAVLLWIFPTDLMTAVSCTAATLIASIMMWEFLFTAKAIRFSSICSMGLAIGYGTGTLNSWLTVPRGDLALATVSGQSVSELANGVAAAIMGCAILLCVGELLEKPIWTTDRKLTITPGIKSILYINTLILVVAAATGKILQGAVKTSGHGRAGVLAVFLSFLLSPTVVLGTVVFLHERTGRNKYFLGLIAIFLWLLTITQGRRELIYVPLVTIAFARLSGYRWGRITFSRVIIAIVALAFVILGGLTYQLFRLAGSAIRTNKIGAETKQAQVWVSRGDAWRIATTSSESNLERRTLVVTFLSDLLYQEKKESPAYGRDLLLQVELVIPGAIFPDKPKIAEEDVASKTLHAFYTDQPNSVFTAGALDLGIWGVFLYPVMVILLYSSALRLGYTYFTYEVFFFSFILFVFVAIQTEMQLEVYFEVMRDAFIFSLFLVVISKFPLFGKHPAYIGGVVNDES
jgi:hypothetical protein